MNILFYVPFNSRSRDNESLILRFQKMGHKVFFLSQSSGNEIIEFLTSHGIRAESTNIRFRSKWDILPNVFFLAKYLRQNKIDLVFSHLDPANIIAAITSVFSRTRIVIVRHYVDELYQTGHNKSLSYKLIYRLAKEIIVVSERARQFMIQTERIKPDKIKVINLSYDFSLFDQPNLKEVENIRHGKNDKLIILTASRLVKEKRPELSVEVIKRLKQQGVPAHLFLLGSGDMQPVLTEMVKKEKLEDVCTVLGYKRNVMDYLEACDILLNPSLVDSSSVIVKEAGIRMRPVIVCRGIGDCDAYIESGTNGVLVDKDHFVEQSVAFLLKFGDDKPFLSQMGVKLNEQVRSLFDVDKNIEKYYYFLQKKK